jgi:predicted DsbA family dithiol-disulfide isomerase
MKQVIKIDIVSDVICPWCYIGKRRVEKAIEALDHLYDFKITYHPFELHPELPPGGQNQKEYLVKKFGNQRSYHQLTNNVARIALGEGLQFDFNKQIVMPNTRRAHVIISGAKEFDKQAEVSEGFFDSYFSRGVDLSKDENLITVGVRAGLERNLIEGWLTDESLLNDIEGSEREMSRLGVHAVPFFIINERYALSGAQTTETFIQALQEIGSKSAIEAAPSCSTDESC